MMKETRRGVGFGGGGGGIFKKHHFKDRKEKGF